MTRGRPSRGRRLAATVLTILLAGCSPAVNPVPSRPVVVPASVPASVSPATAPPAVAPGSCGKVTLAVTPWVGAEADVAVVAYLLRHELGCTVVERQVDDETAWPFLGSRGIDAILENWDHEDLAHQYIEVDHVAQDAGPSGNEGVIGWFAPKFYIDAHPDILTAQTNPSILNAYADAFRTAASGQKGQVLDGEEGFVTEDRAMINGFGLNYTVVYAGSDEAQNEAIQQAVDQRQPILAYHVMPSWFDTKVDLVHVALPAFTPGCNTDPDRVTCDYPAYHLNKVVSVGFATSGSTGYELIKRFSWSNADQDLVAADLAERHLSDDEAAMNWLDAHQATWRAWLP
ncbi:MAG: glycine/betaine ABC transporter substrate-binding protein [Chloroflexi bacterium]|nr:MAG: glycine/betaine ABC transporter substrate-binding protein [Chloroflexota bacterium]